MRRSILPAWIRRSLTLALLPVAGVVVGCAAEGEVEVGGGPQQTERISQERPATQPAGRQAQHVLAYPTGERESSVLLVEKLQPQEVRLNRPYEYQIRVTNLTDQNLGGVVLREQLPGTFEVARTDPPAQPGPEGISQYTIGELGPRQSRTITISGRPTQVGAIDTCTSVTYNPTLCVSTNVVNPILRLTKAGPERADICEPIVYRYTVSNDGTGTERGVRIEERLPQGLVTKEGRDTVTLDVGDLEAGRSREFTVELQARQTGQFTSQAVARSADGEDVQSEQIATTVIAPRLAVQIQGPESEFIGKPITYKVTVTNEGDAPAQRLDLDLGGVDRPQVAIAEDGDQPRLLSVRPGEEGLGTLEPGQSQSFNVTVEPNKEGVLNVTASAKAHCAEAVSQSTQTNVRAIPALLLEVVDKEDPIRIGGEVEYTIMVRNQGSGADNNISITATIPEGQTYISSDGPTQAQVEGRTLRFAPVETLPAGKTVNWTVKTRAENAGDLRFQVQLNSQSLTAQPAMETEPTRLY